MISKYDVYINGQWVAAFLEERVDNRLKAKRSKAEQSDEKRLETELETEGNERILCIN